MKRKVVQQGPSTLMVSLPVSWVRQKGIKKGDEIEMIDDRGGLVICSAKIVKEKKEITIELPDMEARSILFIIRNVYINGYDTLNLHFKSNIAYHCRRKTEMTMMNLVSEEADRLMGFEIVNTTRESCTLKNLSEESTEEFDISLKRSFVIMAEAIAELVKATEEGYPKLEQFGMEVHKQVTKLLAYNLRTLNKIGYKDMTLKMYNVIYKMDDILDQIKYWFRESENHIPTKDRKISEMVRKAHNLFDSCFKLFYTFNLRSYSDFFRQNYKIRDELATVMKSSKHRRFLNYIDALAEELLKLGIARMSLEY